MSPAAVTPLPNTLADRGLCARGCPWDCADGRSFADDVAAADGDTPDHVQLFRPLWATGPEPQSSRLTLAHVLEFLFRLRKVKGVTNGVIHSILDLFRAALPAGHTVPASFYSCRKAVRDCAGPEAARVRRDMCARAACGKVFTGDEAHCQDCGAARYKELQTNSRRDRRPLYYLGILALVRDKLGDVEFARRTQLRRTTLFIADSVFLSQWGLDAAAPYLPPEQRQDWEASLNLFSDASLVILNIAGDAKQPYKSTATPYSMGVLGCRCVVPHPPRAC